MKLRACAEGAEYTLRAVGAYRQRQNRALARPVQIGYGHLANVDDRGLGGRFNIRAHPIRHQQKQAAGQCAQRGQAAQGGGCGEAQDRLRRRVPETVSPREWTGGLPHLPPCQRVSGRSVFAGFDTVRTEPSGRRSPSHAMASLPLASARSTVTRPMGARFSDASRGACRMPGILTKG